jgi:hypothetical protein
MEEQGYPGPLSFCGVGMNEAIARNRLADRLDQQARGLQRPAGYRQGPVLAVEGSPTALIAARHCIVCLISNASLKIQ